MANLDTRSKRASSVGIVLTWLHAPPEADSTLSMADKYHTAWSYSGLAGGPPGVSGAGLERITLGVEDAFSTAVNAALGGRGSS